MGYAVVRECMWECMCSGQVNGESAATGSGANVLGHPVRSLTWLANHLADAGIATSDSQYGAGADTGALLVNYSS